MKSTNKLKFSLLLTFIGLSAVIQSQIYEADFSNENDGFTDHNTNSPPATGAQQTAIFGAAPNSWYLSYPSAPGTDATANSFKVSEGKLVSEDWGGVGVFQSTTINVSAVSTINISAQTVNTGANDDVFKYFYILEGIKVESSNQSTAEGETINYNIVALDVSGASSLIIGFEFSENGANSGYTTSSFTVIENTEPIIGFDTASSSFVETNTNNTTTGIPISLINFDTNISITPSIQSSSTAEAEDYSINLSEIIFTANETLYISLTIKNDADADNETIIINLTVTSGNATLSKSQHTVTVIDDETPAIPSLIITEIAAPGDVLNAKFVEIYNNGETAIDLALEQIHFSKQANGGNFSTLALTGIIQPNSIMSIGNSSNSLAAYGFGTTFDYGSVTGNGDDGYFLYYGGDEINGVLLDAFGAIGIDGTGEDWEYESSRAVRLNPKIIAPNDTWESSEWTIASANVADMTLGALENEFRYDGAWRPNAISNAIATNNIYISSDVVLSNHLEIANFEVASNTITSVNSGISLKVNGTSIGNITYDRTLTYIEGNIEGWHLVASPVGAQNYHNNYADNNNLALSGSKRGLATYTTNDNSWSYLESDDSNAGTFLSGIGYSLKRTSSGIVSFTGSINTASTGVTAPITLGSTDGYNLMGVPYPAYINSAVFLTDNTDNLVSETIWLWNQNTKNYETKVTNDAFVLAPGQGFFVRASTTANLNFAKLNQTNTVDTFQKSSKTEIIVRMHDGESERFTKLYYLPNTSAGFDNGYDGETFGGQTNSVDIFTHLIGESKGQNYQIQSIPNSNYESMIVPIGVHAASGKELTFSAETYNLPSVLNTYLEDRLTNTFTNLGKDNGLYKVILSDKCAGIGRFYLHTTQSALNRDTAVFLDHISIYKKDGTTLIISGLLQNKTYFTLYNILGKPLVYSSFFSNGIKDVSLPRLAKGIYFIQLETAGRKLYKKIILD
jgi:hypothetical protein